MQTQEILPHASDIQKYKREQRQIRIKTAQDVFVTGVATIAGVRVDYASGSTFAQNNVEAGVNLMVWAMVMLLLVRGGSYSFSENKAELRRIKERISDLEKAQKQ